MESFLPISVWGLWLRSLKPHLGTYGPKKTGDRPRFTELMGDRDWPRAQFS